MLRWLFWIGPKTYLAPPTNIFDTRQSLQRKWIGGKECSLLIKWKTFEKHPCVHGRKKKQLNFSSRTLFASPPPIKIPSLSGAFIILFVRSRFQTICDRNSFRRWAFFHGPLKVLLVNEKITIYRTLYRKTLWSSRQVTSTRALTASAFGLRVIPNASLLLLLDRYPSETSGWNDKQ